MTCFLNRPLVIVWIFLPLLASLLSTMLCILIIFLFSKAENTSFIFKIFVIDTVTYAKDLVGRNLVMPLAVHPA